MHLLRDCVVACELWRKLEVPLSHVNSFARSFDIWLKTNCLSEVRYKCSIPCALSSSLLFGLCGKIETRLCLKIPFQTPHLIRFALAKLRNIFIV